MAIIKQFQTSVLSTTDNDSNATFRVVSEADARVQSGCSSVAAKDSSHNHSSHPHYHHHEDTCTNSDLLTSSSGWVPAPPSEQQSSQAAKSISRDQRVIPKTDLPDMIVGLPGEGRGREVLPSNRTNSQEQTGGGCSKGKAYSETPPAGAGHHHVGFTSRAFASSSVGNSFHVEYENLEVSYFRSRFFLFLILFIFLFTG